MNPRARVLFPAAVMITLVAACGGSPGSPTPDSGVPSAESQDPGAPPAAEVTIVASTSGGLAGMDWQVTLDGAAGVIHLDHCGNACPWGARTSRQLSEAETQEITAAFVAAGVREAPERDFGICEFCDDQFHHVIEYEDTTGSYRVEGDGDELPRDLALALNRLIWPDDPIRE